ncbi:MAG: TolC family protein [Candidatus Latescibacteria bacterium]|nr:TolC family protein [Candidatus Latescibacterota bacterium]
MMAFTLSDNGFVRYFVNILTTCLILFFFAGISGAAENEIADNPFSGISGGEILQINIKDAIFQALEQNPTVTIQRQEPAKYQTFASEERADFDPEITASADQNKTKLQRFLGAQPNPIRMTWDRSNYDIGISETLPTGTIVSANMSMTGSISSLYTDQFSGIVGVTVTQALLRGFGIGANLANLRKAKLDIEISEAELKAVAENLVADVEKAYWNLYLTAEEINIQKSSLELADKQLQESLERVAVGRLPELELAAVHAEVATRREALIDAQSRYEQARLNFLFLLNPSGIDIWSSRPVPVDKPFIPTDTLDAIAVHEELGMQFRADLIQAQLNLKKGELDIQQTKNGLLPRLDFFITYGKTTYAKTFKDAIPDLQSPFHEATAGFTFAMPVPNRGARARVERARRTQQQMEMAVINMERLVQLDVRSAYIEAVRSKELIVATRVTRELQERNMDAEQEKFRVGKSTNFLVLQAQRDFTASQLDEARSMVSYLNALIDLYLMEGTMLSRRGIENLSGL